MRIFYGRVVGIQFLSSTPKLFLRKGKRSRDNSRATLSLLASRSHASRVVGIGTKGERESAKVRVLGVDLRAVAGRDLADLLGEEHSPNDPLRYNEVWGRRQGRTPACMQALHKGPVLSMIHGSF